MESVGSGHYDRAERLKNLAQDKLGEEFIDSSPKLSSYGFPIYQAALSSRTTWSR
jgi:hypothetical protein